MEDLLRRMTRRIPVLSTIHPRIYVGIMSIFSLRALQMMMGIVTMGFLSRLLTKDQFGEYHFVLSVVGVLTIFAVNGLDEAVMQSIARGFKGVYRLAVKLSCVSALIASTILLLCSTWYGVYEDRPILGAAFLVAAFLFPLRYGPTQWRSVLTGQEKFSSLMRLEGMNSVIAGVMTVVGIVVFPGNILVPLTAALLVPTIQNLRQTWRNLREIPTDAPVEEGSISYGVKLTIYGSLNIIAKNFDKLLLFFFLSPAALAVYVAADKLVDPMRNAVQDVAAVLAPRFARHERYTGRHDFMFTIFSVCVGAVIVALAFTVMPLALVVVFGEGYKESIPYAQALMCSVAIGNVATLQARFIRSRMDSEGMRGVMVWANIARIAASALLIPIFKLEGAVASVFVYRILYVIFVQFSLRKFRKNDDG